MFTRHDNTLHYTLYDLRKTGIEGLADIFLPEDDDPLVLHVSENNYLEVKANVEEMCINEGNDWMHSLLIPTKGMFNTSDLTPYEMYIVIAHRKLLVKYRAFEDPSLIIAKFASMKKRLFN